MNPSPSAIAWLKTVDTDPSIDAATLAATLNAPSIANPTAQASVSVVLSESALLALLTDPTNGSAVKLVNYVNLASVLADIDTNNHGATTLWGEKLAIAGIITTGEASAIASYIATPIPDPSWPSLISPAIANIGRAVDVSDIATERAS